MTPPSSKLIGKEKEDKGADINVYNRLFNAGTEVTKAREAARSTSAPRGHVEIKKTAETEVPQQTQETHHNILFSPQSILKRSESDNHLEEVQHDDLQRPQSTPKARPKALTFALQEQTDNQKKEKEDMENIAKHETLKRSPHLDSSRKSPLRRPIAELLTPKSTPVQTATDDADSKVSASKKSSSHKKSSASKHVPSSSQQPINANKLSANKAAKLASMAKMKARYAGPTVASHVRQKEQVQATNNNNRTPQQQNSTPVAGNGSRPNSAQRGSRIVQDNSAQKRSTGSQHVTNQAARSPAHHFADEILRVVEACNHHSPMNHHHDPNYPALSFRDEDDVQGQQHQHRSLSPILMGDFETSSSKFINDGEDSMSLHFAMRSNASVSASASASNIGSSQAFVNNTATAAATIDPLNTVNGNIRPTVGVGEKQQNPLQSIENDISTVASCIDDIHGVSLQNSLDPNFNILFDDLPELEPEVHEIALQPMQFQSMKNPNPLSSSSVSQQEHRLMHHAATSVPAPQTSIISVSSRPPSRLRLDEDALLSHGSMDDISFVQPAGTYSPHNLSNVSNVSTFSTSEAATPTMMFRPTSPYEIYASTTVSNTAMNMRGGHLISNKPSSMLTNTNLTIPSLTAPQPPTLRRSFSSNPASSTETLLSSLNPPNKRHNNATVVPPPSVNVISGPPLPTPPTLRRQSSEDSRWANDIYNMLESNTVPRNVGQPHSTSQQQMNQTTTVPPQDHDNKKIPVTNHIQIEIPSHHQQVETSAPNTFNSELNNAMLLSSTSMISFTSTIASMSATPTPRAPVTTASVAANGTTIGVSSSMTGYGNITFESLDAADGEGDQDDTLQFSEDISVIPHVGSSMNMSSSLGLGLAMPSLSRHPSALINPQLLHATSNGTTGIITSSQQNGVSVSMQLDQAFYLPSEDEEEDGENGDEHDKENYSPIGTPTSIAPSMRSISPRKPLQCITEDVVGELQSSSASSGSGSIGSDPISVTSLHHSDQVQQQVEYEDHVDCDLAFIQSGSMSISLSQSQAQYASRSFNNAPFKMMGTQVPQPVNETASAIIMTSMHDLDSLSHAHVVDPQHHSENSSTSDIASSNNAPSSESSEPFIPHQDLNKSIEIEPRLSLPIPIPVAMMKTPKRNNNFLEIEERLSSSGSNQTHGLLPLTTKLTTTPNLMLTRQTSSSGSQSPPPPPPPPSAFDFLSMDVSYTRIPPNHQYNPEERVYEGDEVRCLRELQVSAMFDEEEDEGEDENQEIEDDENKENEGNEFSMEDYEEHSYGYGEKEDEEDGDDIYSNHSSKYGHDDDDDVMVQLQESENDYMELSEPSTIPFAESENDTLGNYAMYLKTIPSFNRPISPFHGDEDDIEGNEIDDVDNDDDVASQSSSLNAADDQFEEDKDLVGPLHSWSATIGQHFHGIEESTISEGNWPYLEINSHFVC